MGPAQTLEQQFKRYRKTKSPKDLAPVFQGLVPQLMGAARRAGLDESGAEDVVQETFLAFIEAEERFEADRPLIPWVRGIAVRQINAERRRRARLKMLFRPGDPELALTQEQDESDTGPLALREFRRKVRQATQSLSPANQEVVTAALFDGQSIDEIATRFSLSRSAVSVRLHRGLRRVREKLGERSALGLVALTVPRGGDVARLAAVGGAGVGWVPVALVAFAAAAALLVAVRPWQVAQATDTPDHSGADDVSDVAVLAEPKEGHLATGPAPASMAIGSRTPGASAEAPTATATASGSLSGSIVSRSGRAPGQPAQVFALGSNPEIVLPTAPMVPVATAEEDGHFTIPTSLLRDDATPLLMIRAGAEIGWIDVTDSARDAGLLPTVELGPERKVLAKVVDGDGQALEGVKMSAFTHVPRFVAPMGAIADEFGYIPTDPYHHLFGATTDDQGHATIQGLFGAEAPGLLLGYTATKPGYARVMHAFFLDDPEDLETEFVMHATESLRLEGRTLDGSGAPVAGVELRFRARGEAPLSDAVVATTDGTGRWSLPTRWLDEYPMFLAFDHPSFAREELFVQDADQLAAEPDDKSHDIRLSRVSPLAGTVKDASGVPVAGAEVTAATIRSFVVTTTDQEGAFSFGGLTRNHRSLTVQGSPAGGATRSTRVAVASHEDTIDIQLPSFEGVAPQLRFEVEGKEEWARAALAARHVQGTVGVLEASEIQGDGALFENVPYGRWTFCGLTHDGLPVVDDVRVGPRGIDEQGAKHIAPAWKPGRVHCMIATEEAWQELSGGDSRCIVVARHARLPGLPDWLYESGHAPFTETYQEANAEDAIELRALVPGRWQIFAKGPGWSTLPVEIEVQAGANERIDLSPTPGGLLRLDFPAISRSSLLRFEIRRSQDDPWHLVAIPSVTVGVAETHHIAVPAGDWQWRATLESNNIGEDFTDIAPPTHGVAAVEAGGEIPVDTLGGALEPVE